FTRSGDTWTEQAKLTASDHSGDTTDHFGASVGLAGDTVVIGAVGANAPNLSQGAAYIFTRSGATWSEQRKLMLSDGQKNDFFGDSVAITGNRIMITKNGDHPLHVFTR